MVEPNNNNDYNSASTFDELLPADMASKAQEIGIKKAHLDFTSTFALAILAGAFIALGSIFFTVSQTTGGVEISWGLSRVIGGLAFDQDAQGLRLIIVAGGGEGDLDAVDAASGQRPALAVAAAEAALQLLEREEEEETEEEP